MPNDLRISNRKISKWLWLKNTLVYVTRLKYVFSGKITWNIEIKMRTIHKDGHWTKMLLYLTKLRTKWKYKYQSSVQKSPKNYSKIRITMPFFVIRSDVAICKQHFLMSFSLFERDNYFTLFSNGVKCLFRARNRSWSFVMRLSNVS